MKKPLILAGLAGALLMLLMIPVGHKVIEYKESPEFCSSCHSMDIAVEEYQQSMHFKNNSGVSADCADCHIPPGVDGVVRSVKAVKEVYHHILGTIDTPEKYEENRMRMAKQAWADFDKSQSSACRTCHTYDAMDFAKQHDSAGAKQMKDAFAANDQNCVTCHRGIAHKMPDMEAEARRQQEAMLEKLKNTKESFEEETLWVKETTSIFAAASADADKVGNVMPMTEVYNLGVEGDFVKVKLVGWQAGRSARGQYAAFGQRILNASLRKSALENVAKGEVRFYEDGGQDWVKTSFEGYIEKSQLTGSEALLSETSNTLYQNQCGSCHATNEFKAKNSLEWQEVVLAYKDKTGLSKEEVRLMTRFLQINGNDFVREL